MATQPRHRTPQEVERDREIRARFADDPSWEELIGAGEVGEASTPLGAYIAFRKGIAGLRLAREGRGLTIEEVAGLCGVDAETLRALEDGRLLDPGVTAIARYAAALGKVPTWEFADLGP